MNKDRRTYAPQDEDDFSDVRENPYGCPKTDYYERQLDRADYLRDEQRDREWERQLEAADARQAADDLADALNNTREEQP